MDDAPYILGADLGQAQDYTALVIVEIEEIPRDDDRRYMTYVRAPELVTHYTVRYLERLPLGTPYPEIVEHIAYLLSEPELDGQTDLGDFRKRTSPSDWFFCPSSALSRPGHS